MTNAAIRQQLHQYIDGTDDNKIKALYTLLRNDMDPQYSFSNEEMNMLHERAEEYLKGAGKTYTVSESHDKIRAQRKKLTHTITMKTFGKGWVKTC